MHSPITVINLFGILISLSRLYMYWTWSLESEQVSFPCDDTVSLNVSMARHGYIGTSPLLPALAISFKLLEFLSIITLHCPQLSLQAFAKALSENQRVVYLLFSLSSYIFTCFHCRFHFVQISVNSYPMPLTLTLPYGIMLTIIYLCSRAKW
jgi:hypothetical protein